MMKYVDKQMLVDPAYSERQLPIAYRRRLRLERRLPYIVENAKSYPDEWNARNATKLKPATERLNLVVTNLMRARREELIDRLVERVTAGPAGARYPNYRSLDPGRLRSYIELVYDLLTSAVRSGERMPFLSHARYIGAVRRDEGFPFAEIEDALRSTGEIVIAALAEHPRLEGHEQFLHDHLRLTVELAIDEAEDAFEEARVSAERVEQ